MGDNYRQIIKHVVDFFNKELPDLQVTEEVLAKPTCENVKKIYSALLLQIGLRTEKQLFNDAESWSISDDVFLGGRRALSLNNAMENFVRNTTQNASWSLRDLSSPDHRRTLVFIRELISFYVFSIARDAELNQVFEEKERRARDELQLRINLGNLNRQLDQKASEFEQLRYRKVELYKDRDELVRKSVQCRASKAQMQEQHDALKTRLDEKTRLKARLEEQLREIEENNEDLRGKLVKSPARLHEEIQEIEKKNCDRAQTIQDCELSISQMQQQLHILSMQADMHLECFKKEFDTVKKDISILENLQRSRNQFLLSIDREKSIRMKLQAMEADLERRLGNDISDLKSQLQLYQSKIEHFRGLINQNKENILVHNNKKECSQAEHAVCQKRIEEAKQKLEDHQSDPFKKAILPKQQEIEDEISKTEKSNEELEKKISQLVFKIFTYRKQYEGFKNLCVKFHELSCDDKL